MKLLVTPRMREIAKSNKGVGTYLIDPRTFLELTVQGTVSSWIAYEGRETKTVAEYNEFVTLGKSALMPFLDIDMDSGKVVGHEGRHRAAALLNEGEDWMEVSLHLRKNGYLEYYTEPYAEETHNPQQYLKVFVTLKDVPRVFSGQFKSFKHIIMPSKFTPFYKPTTSSVMARLAATRETSSLKDTVAFIQSQAETILGTCRFEPPNGVRVENNALLMHVIPQSSPDLKSVGYFAKSLRTASGLTPGIEGVYADNDFAKGSLKVELEKR